MGWLKTYSKAAASTDKFEGRKDHDLLLAVGMLGEAGSIVSEIKKMCREGLAYPGYSRRLTEELGDFLWYFTRLAYLYDAKKLNDGTATKKSGHMVAQTVGSSLDFGAAVGQVVGLVKKGKSRELKGALELVWIKLVAVAKGAGISLKDAGKQNLAKTQSRWPRKRVFDELFDKDYPVEEQLPRKLNIQFYECKRGSRVEVLLRSNRINIGDRITDNIQDPDGYRYHDIFHIAYAVFLGWSPIVRSLLRCKRKSDPAVDENQDVARATALEEAVSAIIFSRAKQMRFFERATQVDYDLLKIIQEITKGYEIAQVSLWQWEMAILEGYRIFRQLRRNRGGSVRIDLKKRRIVYRAPKK